jgi:hypothetical protein
MSKIESLLQRYDATGSLIRNGAEIVAVADPVGARFNTAIRRLLLIARDDLGVWDELIRPAKTLRWRLITHLHPNACVDAATEVIRQTGRLRDTVADEELLDKLTASARMAAELETPLTSVLVDLIGQAGMTSYVLVAASKPAQATLLNGWGSLGVRVLTAAELARTEMCVDHAYAIGPPRFFGPSLVTAPAAFSVSFVIPSWVQDRSIPSSVITSYADSRPIRIRSHTRVAGSGDVTDVAGGDTPELADDLLPQPVWEAPRGPLREPGSDEVTARKVLLSGDLAIWLDDSDGERIRTLDPTAPSGERVIYAQMATVRPGTYLLLRQGETERGAIHAIAIGLLGSRAAGIDATQRAWKEQLARRLSERGHVRVAAELRRHGVRAVGRARAWADPSLIRPHDDGDFRHLLDWLGIPADPTFSNATVLRRAHHQAGTQIREQLEKAVEAVDLARLDRDGYLGLELKAEGFRKMIATRVLAISPHAEVIARRNARVLFPDRSARWLE